MPIEINYATQVRTAVGVVSERITVADGCSIRDLISLLVASHGPRLEAAIFDANGKLQPSILVCVNGQQIADLSHAVADGDEVLLISAISGG